jgi:hypothetical protein
MRKTLFILAFFFLVMSTECFATAWTVVDAETGEPIEGAIVLVEWTIQKGLPGLTHTESYKVVDKVTDDKGRVRVYKVLNPLVEPPRITVYKQGYVAWSNTIIFTGTRKKKRVRIKERTDFEWKDGYVIRMERFREGYSYIDHNFFIDRAIRVGFASDKKRRFLKTYQDAEFKELRKEREALSRKRRAQERRERAKGN